ncbi:50S ribosomal protein L24 [Candidatus Amesbacteria bacterium RIFCSPHIGHO2_01_FULL_47_34]|uniref:Large ribosomal subunit protein uL24 n=2 Tax=Candidatus Amesiibacteriota TaxID=1752730 RepID=A0A1F4ZXL0_9BACT|nr:MAG: 50S ribosomal protein L24 [Candidatus Amesbacteria bacterium RIFCSPHIGHO2_01_FULL_47_34]OGD01543.1 MAG: 50S ribosomal protein L24 [Candidatus Amesbacteria bacterium RIFCSPLOWO2_01_FULL_47_33]OGD10164.1 MAG: 50S ribosomal protein L24 [Candidatus Amesbacteria bacterium RIFOXYB1_FULL_47_9]
MFNNLTKLKIKKGDTVVVSIGKDKGRQGKVERIILKEAKVLLPGINQYKKHRKPQGESRPGEILTLDRPLPVANLALICPKCKQPTRVGYRFDGAKKLRVCRKCEQDID